MDYCGLLSEGLTDFLSVGTTFRISASGCGFRLGSQLGFGTSSRSQGPDGVRSSRSNVLTNVFWDEEELWSTAGSLAEGREVKKLVHWAFSDRAVTKLDSSDDDALDVFVA